MAAGPEPGAPAGAPAGASPESNPQDGRGLDLRRLEQAALHLPQPAFAVMDGAHWADMATELARIGVRGRSLFLGAGAEVEAAGPWLVPLDPAPGATMAVLDLVGDKPAAMFWGCAAGEAALWRHLRTIAQIRMGRVPDGPAPDGVPPETGPGSDVVSFRYWDPRAVSCVLPLLDQSQFARVLGPTDELVFHDPKSLGGVGVRRAQRTPDLPSPPPGMLSLTGAQMLALDEVMQDRSRRRIGLYLRQVTPEEAGQMSPPELEQFVLDAEAEGRLAGLKGERAHGQWAYLALTTGGAVGRDGTVLGYVTHGGGVPDTNLDRLFERMVGLARAEAGH